MDAKRKQNGSAGSSNNGGGPNKKSRPTEEEEDGDFALMEDIEEMMMKEEEDAFGGGGGGGGTSAPMEVPDVDEVVNPKLKWSRPKPPNINPKEEEITFQQMDTDHYISEPREGKRSLPSFLPPSLPFSFYPPLPLFSFILSSFPLSSGMPGSKESQVAVIRMFGITADHHSVALHVHGFLPYFYVTAPTDFKKEDCQAFR